MIRRMGLAALAAIVVAPAIPDAAAQETPAVQLSGTRLDVTATGYVNRIPDIVRIEAGVHTQAPTAAESMRQNQALMARVRAALERAGTADRDIQTSSFELQPVYRNTLGVQATVAYETSNQLFIRIRDVARSGPVLDALVAEGVNDIQGPILGFENAEQSLDEARVRAITTARARADLYARGLGMRVRRAVQVSEGVNYVPRGNSGDNLANSISPAPTASTIDTGGRRLSATVNVIFELE